MKHWSQHSHHSLTMTVRELRAKLAEFQDDAPVVVAYEGVENSIQPSALSVVSQEDTDTGRYYSLAGCVMIDAEQG